VMPIPSIAQLSATMRWCIALLRAGGGDSFRASTSMVRYTRSCCGEPCLCFALSLDVQEDGLRPLRSRFFFFEGPLRGRFSTS